MTKRPAKERPIIGWREWVALPQLGISRIKVKVDTGARSSALHAYDFEKVRRRGRPSISFKIHPLQRSTSKVTEAVAEILDERLVRSSSGRQQLRWVIRTDLEIMGECHPIELTLTRRDEMGFRMLLGREALRGHFLVDPQRSFLSDKRIGIKARKKKKKKKK